MEKQLFILEDIIALGKKWSGRNKCTWKHLNPKFEHISDWPHQQYFSKAIEVLLVRSFCCIANTVGANLIEEKKLTFPAEDLNDKIFSDPITNMDAYRGIWEDLITQWKKEHMEHSNILDACLSWSKTGQLSLFVIQRRLLEHLITLSLRSAMIIYTIESDFHKTFIQILILTKHSMQYYEMDMKYDFMKISTLKNWESIFLNGTWPPILFNFQIAKWCYYRMTNSALL